MSTHLMIHSVAKIELTTRYVDNNGSRTIRITDEDGMKFDLTVFGETEALESLPKSPDFVAHFRDEAA